MGKLWPMLMNPRSPEPLGFWYIAILLTNLQNPLDSHVKTKTTGPKQSHLCKAPHHQTGT